MFGIIMIVMGLVINASRRSISGMPIKYGR
jgi:hypothetical protein